MTQQMQAFFTVGLAAIFLGEVPTVRQSVGMTFALAGLILIGLTVDAQLSVLGLALAMGGALSWAVGNVLVKRTRDTPMFALVARLSPANSGARGGHRLPEFLCILARPIGGDVGILGAGVGD